MGPVFSTAEHTVVITGLGAITPLGLNVAEFWQAVTAGRSGVGPITQFDASNLPHHIAAEVKGFDPTNYLDRREAKRMARFTQFAVAAVQEAIASARLDLAHEDRTRIGLEIGSAVGGIGLIEEQALVLREKGRRRINPALLPAVLPNMAACQIAIILGIQGPTSCPVAACATGVVAIGEAFRRLQRGEIDVAIAGGTDAVTTPLAVAAFGGLGALSKRNDEPERACRPFDADRDGTVIGEGAAVVVMETLEHAVRRGAPILAQVAGYGFTEDAYHLVAPDPTGGPAAAAMSLAIRESGLAPFDLGCISAHATATPLNDVAETLAIKTALGEVAYRVPVSALKSMVGHMLGAAGAISVIVVVKTIETGIIPPTINLERPDPRCDLDYVPHTARAARVDAALANAFGFGGQNASLIVRRFGE